MQLRVNKIRFNAKLPKREHATDAGADVYYCPAHGQPYFIAPNSSAILPTGLRIEVPFGYMLEVMNKGGIAAKKSLVVGSCVVDFAFTGEIFVNLHNIGSSYKTIEPGDKLAQLVFVKIATDIEFVEDDSIYDDENTSRGDGALGSTGYR